MTATDISRTARDQFDDLLGTRRGADGTARLFLSPERPIKTLNAELDGHRAVEVFAAHIAAWERFLEDLKALEADGWTVRTVLACDQALATKQFASLAAARAGARALIGPERAASLGFKLHCDERNPVTERLWGAGERR